MSALRKVLVVDDDPTIGKSFARVLSAAKGYQVTTVLGAQEALDKMLTEEFDMVYTDIKMPGMDGIEFTERVKAKAPWTPVMVITGFGTESEKRRATEAGAEGFLNKPLSPDMIEGSANRIPPVLRVVTPTTPVEAPIAQEPEMAHWKSVLLFLAAPFIGLMYALFLPLVGIGMLAYTGYTAFNKTKIFVKAKNIGLFIAAPFIGLAYAVSLPFLGLGMLAWVGGKALISSRQTN